MNKKGESEGVEITAGQVIGLILAVLVLLALAAFIIKLIWFATDTEAVSKSQDELKEIKGELLKLQPSDKKEYHILYVPEWYLFSSEFGALCESPGQFCLCVCEQVDCGSTNRACIPTEKFVVLQRQGLEARYIKLEGKAPITIQLSSVDQEAYPYIHGKQAVDGWSGIQATTPLFFTFDQNQWKWSPDLLVWMEPSTMQVSDGKWKSQEPVEDNQEFLRQYLANPAIRYSKPEGEKILAQFNAHESKGFYRINLP